MNTNHESDDPEELKRLARNDIFLGFRIRVVDENEQVLFEPPVREREKPLSIADIAILLKVPIIDPDDFSDPDIKDDV